MKRYYYSDYTKINEEETAQQSENQKVSVPTVVERTVSDMKEKRTGKVRDVLLPDGRYVSDIYGKKAGFGLLGVEKIGVAPHEYYYCTLRDNSGIGSCSVAGYILINATTGDRLIKDFPDNVVLSDVEKIYQEPSIVKVGCKWLSSDGTKLDLEQPEYRTTPTHNLYDLNTGKPLLNKWYLMDRFRNGRAAVEAEEGSNIINTKGEFLLKEWLKDISSEDENNYRTCRFENDELDNDTNLMNEKGEVMLAEKVSSIETIEIEWRIEDDKYGVKEYEGRDYAYFYIGTKNVKSSFSYKKSSSGVDIDEKKFILDDKLNLIVGDYDELEELDTKSGEDGASYIVKKYSGSGYIYNILGKDGLVYPHNWLDDYDDGPSDSHLMIVTFTDKSKGLFSKFTISPVVMKDGTELFDELKVINVMDKFNDERYAAVRNGYKINLINISYDDDYKDGTSAIGGTTYLNYVFKDWVDDLKMIGNALFVSVDGKDRLVWKDGKTYACKVDTICRAANGVFMIEDESDKFNFLKIDEDGPFSTKWFDGAYDFGDDDLSRDDDDAYYPIVEWNGKYTYINTENFRFLFQQGKPTNNRSTFLGVSVRDFVYDNNDWESVRWFEECEPYREVKDSEGYNTIIFPVVENGENKFLTEYGSEVDENGNDIDEDD